MKALLVALSLILSFCFSHPAAALTGNEFLKHSRQCGDGDGEPFSCGLYLVTLRGQIRVTVYPKAR